MSYGTCPICGANGVNRERRMNGNDKCEHGCIYPSRNSIPHGSDLVLDKQTHPAACKCQNREYWIEQNANFCGACGGNLQ